MEQELTSNKTIAIIGAGPAGCICAKFLQDYKINADIFEYKKTLSTILPTGGGRCNLANAIYDFKDLAKNYPRGEKFLYSVLSKFSTQDTIETFKQLGIETYIQEDNRIFPISNSSKNVQEAILKNIKNNKIIKEKVLEISKLDTGYKIKTNKSEYLYDIVVFSIGGHSNFDIFKNLDIKIVEPTQSLVGLETEEDFADISGVSIKNVKFIQNKQRLIGDILFTHKGISGPLIYKISSINARCEMPYKINLSICENINLQELLDNNSKKEIKNLLSQIVPKSFAEHILKKLIISLTTPCHQINGKMRNSITDLLENYEINITKKFADGEVVTCGGVDLKEINSKNLQHKTYKNLYFCGEVLDIDGFCGGFNLQNCWSTGYIVANEIYNSLLI